MLTKQIAQKEKEILYLKNEVICANQRKVELCLDAKTQQFWMKYWATRSPQTIKQVLAMKEWVTDSAIEMKLSFQDTKMQIKRNSMYLQNKLNSCMTILSVTKNEFHIVKCFKCNYDGHVAKFSYYNMWYYDWFGHKDQNCSKKVKKPRRIHLGNTHKKARR